MIHRCWLAGLLALLFTPMFAAEPGSDWGDLLVPWKTDCSPKGCLMGTDVLRGASGLPTPPDRSDTREYISVYVAINRDTKKPAFFAFHVDPRAVRADGIFIAFTHSSGDGKNYRLEVEKPAVNLPFTSCDDNSCVARVVWGADPKLDLLERFLNSNHLLVMYTRDGQHYRTMIMLSSFKKEYQRILTKELGAN